MKITERQLRRVIREVIKEAAINEMHPALYASAKHVMDRQAQEKARQDQKRKSSSHARRKYHPHDVASYKEDNTNRYVDTNFDFSDSSILKYELVMEKCKIYFEHCVDEFPDAVKPEAWATLNIPDFKSEQLSEEFKQACIELLYDVKESAGRYLRVTPQDKRKHARSPNSAAMYFRYDFPAKKFYNNFYRQR